MNTEYYELDEILNAKNQLHIFFEDCDSEEAIAQKLFNEYRTSDFLFKQKDRIGTASFNEKVEVTIAEYVEKPFCEGYYVAAINGKEVTVHCYVYFDEWNEENRTYANYKIEEFRLFLSENEGWQLW